MCAFVTTSNKENMRKSQGGKKFLKRKDIPFKEPFQIFGSFMNVTSLLAAFVKCSDQINHLLLF